MPERYTVTERRRQYHGPQDKWYDRVAICVDDTVRNIRMHTYSLFEDEWRDGFAARCDFRRRCAERYAAWCNRHPGSNCERSKGKVA
jgi:hypothetical protein